MQRLLLGVGRSGRVAIVAPRRSPAGARPRGRNRVAEHDAFPQTSSLRVGAAACASAAALLALAAPSSAPAATGAAHRHNRRRCATSGGVQPRTAQAGSTATRQPPPEAAERDRGHDRRPEQRPAGLDSVGSLLGAQGTTFANSYTSFPLCCPSRATFLTGQYAHNHGVRTSDSPHGLQQPRPHQHPRRLAAPLRLPHGDGRQVPERLRGQRRHPRARHRREGDPARLGRVVRAHRRQRPAPLPVQAERERRRPLLRPRPQELRHRRARLAGRRLRQAARSAPEALLPLVQPDRPPRRGRQPVRGQSQPHPRPAPPRRLRRRDLSPHPELRRGRRQRQAPVRPGQGEADRRRDRRHRPPLSRARWRACWRSTTRSSASSAG